MVRVSSNFKADSLSVTGEIHIPLVIIKKSKLLETFYHGFIPGLTAKDVICKTIKECEQSLNTLAKELIEKYAKEKQEFPFFPTEKEIRENFDNVTKINFIKLTSQKRANN